MSGCEEYKKLAYAVPKSAVMQLLSSPDSCSSRRLGIRVVADQLLQTSKKKALQRNLKFRLGEAENIDTGTRASTAISTEAPVLINVDRKQ